MEKTEKKFKLTLCDGCALMGIIILIGSIAQPLVSRAVNDGKLYDLADRLETVRASVKMYKTAHGLLPGQQHPADHGITAGEFIGALTGWDGEGNDLYRHSFPGNPYMTDADAAAAVTCVNDPEAEPTGTESTGWWFNTVTGDFRACDSKFHTNY